MNFSTSSFAKSSTSEDGMVFLKSCKIDCRMRGLQGKETWMEYLSLPVWYRRQRYERTRPPYPDGVAYRATRARAFS